MIFEIMRLFTITGLSGITKFTQVGNSSSLKQLHNENVLIKAVENFKNIFRKMFVAPILILYLCKS